MPSGNPVGNPLLRAETPPYSIRAPLAFTSDGLVRICHVSSRVKTAAAQEISPSSLEATSVGVNEPPLSSPSLPRSTQLFPDTNRGRENKARRLGLNEGHRFCPPLFLQIYLPSISSNRAPHSTPLSPLQPSSSQHLSRRNHAQFYARQR